MQQQSNSLEDRRCKGNFTRAHNLVNYHAGEFNDMAREFNAENQDDWDIINDVIGESLSERMINDYEPEYGSDDWNARERAAYQREYPDSNKPAEVNAHLSAWITPSGTFYNVPSCSHEAWANAWHNCDAARLESKGWVHLSFTGIHYRNELTQAQIDILYDVMTMIVQRNDNSRMDAYETRFVTAVTILLASNRY